MTAQPVFFHADLDAFFAAVEQLDHPEYRGKPVIVGGERGKRGVVSTCSYEARAFGVHSAMPMNRAEALCPDGIYVRGRMHRYHEKSREVMAVFSRWSPSVQQISVDEAFIDMTGTERLFGPPELAAAKLKASVKEETGLTVSIGVAPNRYVAKIASGLNKPDGLTLVPSGGEQEFMRALRLKDVWGAGEKTRQRLEEAGLGTVPLLLECSEPLLQGILGKAGGSFLFNALRGCDPGIFTGSSASRSISSEHTFPFDIKDAETVETAILELASDVSYRMMDSGLSSKTVHIKIRYDDFTTVSIQETFDTTIKDMDDLFRRSCLLFRRKYTNGVPVRLIGVGVFNLTDKPEADQLDLFAAPDSGKKRKVQEAVHALEKKRGKGLVTRARLLDRPGGREE